MSRPTAPPLLLAIRVKAGAKRAGILGWHGDALKVAVRSVPERGRANEELLALLSAALALPASALSLASGATSQNKRVRVLGLLPAELRRRIDQALPAE